MNSDTIMSMSRESSASAYRTGELPDLGQRLEPVEALVGVGGFPGSES